jgi:FkbM family methyltransferase
MRLLNGTTPLSNLLNRGIFSMTRYTLNRMLLKLNRDIFGKKYVQRKIHSYRMNLNLHDQGIGKTLLLFGSREEDHKYILEQELKPGMTVLDLGANVGYYALMESNLVGPTGHVYAVEPHPNNFKELQNNIALNNKQDHVTFYNLAGSNTCSTEKLYVSKMSNLHSLYKEASHNNKDVIEIKTITISEFIKNKKNIDFLRMDVEGYEIEVFEGMQAALKNNINFRPSILFETHRPKYSEPHHSLRKGLNSLFDFGYIPKILISDELPRAKFKDFGLKPDIRLKADGITRGLYYHMDPELVIKFACDLGSVRGLFLQHQL